MSRQGELFSGSDTAGALDLPAGARYLPRVLAMPAQIALARDIAAVVAAAPFYVPTMPRWGTPLSVRMTNCGALGWVTDKRGYRYQETHPETGKPWPAIPEPVLAVWGQVLGSAHPGPQACLVNWYSDRARMGLHVDSDERDFSVPVLSISLGQAATFRVGGLNRDDPSSAFALRSGDVFVLGGAARRAYHGVDRVRRREAGDACPRELVEAVPEIFGGPDRPGRLNLTLRFVG